MVQAILSKGKVRTKQEGYRSEVNKLNDRTLVVSESKTYSVILSFSQKAKQKVCERRKTLFQWDISFGKRKLAANFHRRSTRAKQRARVKLSKRTSFSLPLFVFPAFYLFFPRFYLSTRNSYFPSKHPPFWNVTKKSRKENYGMKSFPCHILPIRGPR